MINLFPGCASGQSSKSAKAHKILVVYFSRSGNTQAVANEIQSFTDADMFRIETVEPYPEDYHRCTEVAQAEKNDGARPEIKGSVENIGQYDIVFIGFPIWWSTYPMAVATFLDAYDLAGKTVVPFCTHEGSRDGESFTDLRKATPESTHLEGLAVRGNQAGTARAEVENWLGKINIID